MVIVSVSFPVSPPALHLPRLALEIPGIVQYIPCIQRFQICHWRVVVRIFSDVLIDRILGTTMTELLENIWNGSAIVLLTENCSTYNEKIPARPTQTGQSQEL
jgi:hypothetical protein